MLLILYIYQCKSENKKNVSFSFSTWLCNNCAIWDCSWRGPAGFVFGRDTVNVLNTRDYARNFKGCLSDVCNFGPTCFFGFSAVNLATEWGGGNERKGVIIACNETGYTTVWSKKYRTERHYMYNIFFGVQSKRKTYMFLYLYKINTYF